MLERLPNLVQDIANKPRWSKGVSDVEAFIREQVETGALPATEKDILTPTPEQIDAVELARQADIITDKYASKFMMSEAQFRDQIIPQKFPEVLPRQEVLTLPKLVVQPHPKYLSVRELFDMEGVDLSSDWSKETLQLLEEWSDKEWTRYWGKNLSPYFSPVIAVRVSDPESHEAFRGKTDDAVRKAARPPLRPVRWEALAILRDDPTIVNRVHLHMTGLTAGPDDSPGLDRSRTDGVGLDRRWTDFADGSGGLAVA